MEGRLLFDPTSRHPILFALHLLDGLEELIVGFVHVDVANDLVEVVTVNLLDFAALVDDVEQIALL